VTIDTKRKTLISTSKQPNSSINRFFTKVLTFIKI